jgi:hypothetical protein
MNKTERIIVGVAVGFLCPFLTFVFFWWTSAATAKYSIMHFSDNDIAIAALTGLACGIVLDAFYLKRWIAYFYIANWKLLVPLYLCCSAIAVAFFMGLPFGNLILGTLAGTYVGRRKYHSDRKQDSIASTARRAAIFTALITAMEAVPIGLLALKEEIVERSLRAGLGISKPAIMGSIGVGSVILACIALATLQFWCTRAATRLAFGRGQAEAASRSI